MTRGGRLGGRIGVAVSALMLSSMGSTAVAQGSPGAAPPPRDGLVTLMTSPWREILLTCGVIFGLWFLYLSRNALYSLMHSISNVLWRRSDRRTLGWVVVVCGLAWLGWSSVVLLGQSTPETQYFAMTGGQLIVVIAIVLLVVAFITWLVMLLFHLGARAIMSRRYELFVGWHFLRSHRAEHHEIRCYEGGRKPHWLLLVTLAALLGGAAYGAGLVAWRQHIGQLSAVVPAARVALAVLAVTLMTWPLRPLQRPGTIGLLDRAAAWLRNLPNLLSVTPTTFISIVGVGVGVWALVVVLSVMAGFENDLRSKILATNPHVVIQDQEPMEGIGDVRPLLESLRRIEGVEAAIPYVQGEVIITSRKNRNVALKLRGIDPAELESADHHLNRDVVSGNIANLLSPERIVPSARWQLNHTQETGADTLPSPLELLRAGTGDAPDDIEPTPLGAPPGPGAPAPPGAEGGTDGDRKIDIEPTPIPGTETVQIVNDEGLRPGILLGKELAGSLQVDVGGEVTVVSPRDDAGFLGIQPRARTFRVAGIFHTGMYEFDLKLAYVRMSEAQRFFHLSSDINRIELRLDDPDRSGEVLAAVEKLLSRPSLEALDWKALNRNLFSALQLEKIVMFVVLAFIVLVASFNIIGSLVMIILDKAQEIGILKSMGATRGAVRRLFLVLGGLIGLIGSSAGLAVGWLTCWMIRYIGIQLPRQYYIDKLPVHVDTSTLVLVFVAGIAICLAATLYPAHEAARLEPVEGLRYD